MHRGFIPLHRKTKDNWIYEDCNKLGAWCKILMEVNHKPNKKELDGDIVSCDRGQSINSLVTWARVFGKGWTVAKVRTFFKTLQSDSMIDIKGLRKTTRLTVCNYESYNNDKQTDNMHVTDRQQTDNMHVTTNNNDNNENNDKNVNLEPLKKTPKPSVYFSEDQINEVYSVYPIKKGKADGYKKLKKIKYSDELKEKMIKQIEQCKKETKDTKFHRHFSSWVNQQGWEDMEDVEIENENKITNKDLEKMYAKN